MKKIISLFILFISFCSYPSDLVVSKLPGRSEKYLVESAPDKNHPTCFPYITIKQCAQYNCCAKCDVCIA